MEKVTEDRHISILYKEIDETPTEEMTNVQETRKILKNLVYQAYEMGKIEGKNEMEKRMNENIMHGGI